MISPKKLYFLYFLTLAVTSLSYVSFAYFPLPEISEESQDVKGLSVTGPFAFLPAPENAQEVSSTYSRNGLNVSFVVPEGCTESLSFYYETILVDHSWESTYTDYLENGLLRGYSKDDLGLEISYFSEDSSDGPTCLVNLIGSSN